MQQSKQRLNHILFNHRHYNFHHNPEVNIRSINLQLKDELTSTKKVCRTIKDHLMIFLVTQATSTNDLQLMMVCHIQL